MNPRLIALCMVVMAALALLATAVTADEENQLFLPAVSGGVPTAVTWTPTATSSATATLTPTHEIVQPPDDLIDCSNPDFAGLPQCQGGATPTPGGTIP